MGFLVTSNNGAVKIYPTVCSAALLIFHDVQVAVAIHAQHRMAQGALYQTAEGDGSRYIQFGAEIGVIKAVAYIAAAGFYFLNRLTSLPLHSSGRKTRCI